MAEALDSLTFDVGFDTAEFEQGARNVEQIVRELMGTVFRTLSQSAEGIETSLTGVTDASGEMGTALEQGGTQGVEAMKKVIDATRQTEQQTQATTARLPDLWANAARRIEFSMKTVLRSFVGPMAAVFGVSRMFGEYTQKADRLGKFAELTGLDTKEVQGWGEAVTRAGGSAEGFQASVKSLNRQLQRMNALSKGSKKGGMGGGRLKPILDQLGINATDSKGNVKEVFDLLPELADAAERIGKTKFSGLAPMLDLDEGTVRLLMQGRAEVEKTVERQKQLGMYTKEDTKTAAAFNDAIADLQQVFRAFGAILMRTVTPALTAVAQALTWLFVKINEHKELIRGVIVILAGQLFGKVFPLGMGMIQKVGALIAATAKTAVARVAMAATGIRFSLATVKAAWASLVATVKGAFMSFALPLIVEDLFYFFMGKKSLTGYAIYKLKAWFDKAGEWVKGWWESLVGWFIEKWNTFVEALTGWMPEILKKQLGLAKRTQEEERAAAETKEFQELSAKENPAGLPEDADIVNKLWARAKENVAARQEEKSEPAAQSGLKNERPQPAVQVETERDKKAQEQIIQRTEEIVIFEGKCYDDALKQAREEFGQGDIGLKLDTIAQKYSALSQKALDGIALIGENLKIAASHDAEQAISPVVTENREVKIDVQQNVTQNVTTNDPQTLADKAAAPMKRKAEGLWSGMTNWWNSGQNNVGGGTVAGQLGNT